MESNVSRSRYTCSKYLGNIIIKSFIWRVIGWHFTVHTKVQVKSNGPTRVPNSPEKHQTYFFLFWLQNRLYPVYDNIERMVDLTRDLGLYPLHFGLAYPSHLVLHLELERFRKLIICWPDFWPTDARYHFQGNRAFALNRRGYYTYSKHF